MKVQSIAYYNQNFTGKEQKFVQESKQLVPIYKITATPASEPPKTFLGKVRKGIKYFIDRLYYYCFCTKIMSQIHDIRVRTLVPMDIASLYFSI